MRSLSDPLKPKTILEASLRILKSSVPALPKAPLVPTKALSTDEEFLNRIDVSPVS